MKINKLVLLPLFFLVFLFLSPLDLFAVSRRTSTESAVKEKIKTQKLNVCENRKEAVNKHYENLTKRVDNLIEKFARITERVDKYYTDKLLTSGLVLENYNQLKGEISKNKETIEKEVEDAKKKTGTFNCEEKTPKDKLIEYRDSMKRVLAALKSYKRSVRNFIVAVHTLAGREKSKPSVTITQ